MSRLFASRATAAGRSAERSAARSAPRSAARRATAFGGTRQAAALAGGILAAAALAPASLERAAATAATATPSAEPAGASTVALPLVAQEPSQWERGAASVALRFRRLDGVKRALMIAAHPDDEDTGLLAALARERGVETAYLSLSRGEGGQNLIGSRLGEGLGIVRTGELVAARAMDGGRQYFTRAFDFGYSKTLDETARHWPLEEVVRDVVFVIRTFRPHVVVSVFSGTPRDRHGQHQISGVAAREAFRAAGDPRRFPELAEHGAEPWTPVKLYQSARSSPAEATLRVATGEFDALLGMSPFQLAMASRSRHRSQDMGAPQLMGPRESALALVESRVGENGDADVFAGVDTTLAGQLPDPLPASWPPDAMERLETYRAALAEARSALAADRTDGSVPALLRGAQALRDLVREAPAGPARETFADRLALVSETALAAAGVVVDVRADRNLLVSGEAAGVDAIVWNGGPFALEDVTPAIEVADADASPDGVRFGVLAASPVLEATTDYGNSFFFRSHPSETPQDGRVPPGAVARWSWQVTPGARGSSAAPYFLEQAREGSMYVWPEDARLWAAPFDPAPVRAAVSLRLAAPAAAPAPGPSGTPGEGRPDAGRAESATLEVARDAVHVGLDKALGEYRERVLAAPALDVGVRPKTMVWPLADTAAREVAVEVANLSAAPRSGLVRLEAGEAWTVDPAAAPFSLAAGASAAFAFRVAPKEALKQDDHVFRAVAEEASGARFDGDYDVVAHPHIPRAALHETAAVRVSAFPLTARAGVRVGYVMGSGDEGADALRQAGMTVEMLDDARLRSGAFEGLDVLALGVRAYETRPALAAANDHVLAFARDGGTVVVQYNKYEYPQGDFAPYPVSMSRPHDRIADETAPVRILLPRTPIFQGPNLVGPADFDGWVQERGLYFLSEWDPRFAPALEMTDPGEAPKRGGLMVASVGDGLYVYTGLAFFRQFPAGVPGAYRLFANLASLRAEDWRAATRAAGAEPPRP